MLDQVIYNFQAAIDRGACADTAIVDSEGRMSWQALFDLTRRCEESLSGFAGRRVGVAVEPGASTVATLAALASLEADVFLLADQTDPHQNLQELGQRLGLSAIIRPSGGTPQSLTVQADDRPASGRGRVTILTSGTEGRPKPVTHTWQSLARPVRKTAAPQRWVLTYRLELYAGLQVMLQALTNYGTLIVPPPGADPNHVAKMMLEHRAEFGSATPSYWRRLLMFADPDLLRQVPLRQITLGGEVADQKILDNLRTTFSQARIVHIYATTELGRCFSVTDGKSGFPVEYLDVASRGTESRPASCESDLKIEEGQLWVRSSNRTPSGEAGPSIDDWFPTGDLVEIEADRVMFVGRNGDMINVGGNKVRPIVVERIVRSVPGVEDVRVYGTDSSVAGQLVCCDIVPSVGLERDEILKRVNEACRKQMAAHQIPRIINVVPEIATTTAGKVSRRPFDT